MRDTYENIRSFNVFIVIKQLFNILWLQQVI